MLSVTMKCVVTLRIVMLTVSIQRVIILSAVFLITVKLSVLCYAVRSYAKYLTLYVSWYELPLC